MLLQRGKGLNYSMEVFFCPCRFGFFVVPRYFQWSRGGLTATG